MKIAVTSQGKDMESDVDARFGRAKYFIVVDTEDGSFKAADNAQNVNAVQGAGIQAGQKIVALGVKSVITGNIGPKAFSVLRAAEIEVFLKAEGTVREAIESFKAGELQLQKEANVSGHW